MIGYGLGAVALVGIAWLANGVRRIGAVSRSAPIDPRPGSALALIDLQTVFWENGPYSDEAKSTAKTAILEEVRAAQSAGIPVIALRQEWSIPSTKVIARLTMKGQAIAGTPGTGIATPFADLADHVLVKRVQDGFETGELDDLLARLNVGNLRLVGLDFNYCVLKTALAARNRGYEVTVVGPGTLAATSTDKARTQLASAGVALSQSRSAGPRQANAISSDSA